MAGSGAVDLDWPWREALDRRWRDVPWVVLGVTVNGQRPDLVEVACLPIDGGRQGLLQSWLLRPQERITNEEVEQAPAFAEVASEIRDAMAGRVVVGHHLHDDVEVLARAMGGEWMPAVWVDTSQLAMATWPDRRTYALHALAEDLGVQSPEGVQQHRAGHQAVLAAAVFLVLAEAGGDEETGRELMWQALGPRVCRAASRHAAPSGGPRGWPAC